MNYRNTIIASALAFTGLLTATTASAQGFYSVAPDYQIQQCVAEIGKHADYSGGARVEHDVLSERRRSVGYKLTIGTTIYSDNGSDVIREYATTCVAAPSEKPVVFRIRENKSGA